jgi:hypothetical protein
MVTPKFTWKKTKIYKGKTMAGIGSGYEQAQGHQLRAYILTMKLMVIPKLMWEKKITWKKPLQVPAVAMCKPRAMSIELTCSHSSSLIVQNSVEKNKFNNEKTTAGTGSGYEQARGHQFWAHKLINKLRVTSKFLWKKYN